MAGLILEPRSLSYLDGLRLSPRRRFAGSVRGERTTQAKGISIEFADYREYAEGDDLRHLDWNVLARLGHAVTKTYRDEEDLGVHLLVDTSASMDFGDPSKLSTSIELAVALGFVALTGGDTVYPRLLSGGLDPTGKIRGRAGYPRLCAWANQARAEGTKPLSGELRAFAAGTNRTGIVAVLSDGLDPLVCGAVRSLAARGHEVWFLQVLSEPELSPDLEGDLRLLDAETAGAAEVTINSQSLREYRAALGAHNEALAAECQRSGGRYSLVEAGMPLHQVVRDVWKRERWLE